MPTLLDDVAFGPLNQGCDANEAQLRSEDAIAKVGLTGLEQRSATICRAVRSEPHHWQP